MMSITSRRELLAVVAPRYQAARGEERTHILEEFVASTGYHRKYAPPRAQSSDHQGNVSQETSASASVCVCGATGAGDVLASATGRAKKEAEQEAARLALLSIDRT